MCFYCYLSLHVLHSVTVSVGVISIQPTELTNCKSKIAVNFHVKQVFHYQVTEQW